MIDLQPLVKAVDRYRVQPGGPVDLAAHDPRDAAAFDGGKRAGKELAGALTDRLEALQEQLYATKDADQRHRVLVVLQAMDTGGKDSTIRHVFDGVDPQGVKVAPFGVPTEDERAHDYLWRVHPHVPADGHIAIFNRSHYEDVLVVRVKKLAPELLWRRRYEHIRAFEQLLADEGTTIVKFFLHISRSEQAERLQARLDDPEKRWKFRRGDLDDRALWDDYLAAYAEALTRTSTEQAPWYVVPADRKWYRNLVVGGVLVGALEGLGMAWPDPEEELDGVVVR